jgi:LPS export ABC transporter protein LptC
MSAERLISFVTSALLSKRLRPWLMTAVAGLVWAVVALSPSSLEERSGPANAPLDPETLASEDQTTLATGIPTHRIPEYSVDQFQYASTVGSEKQWKIIADRAFLYNENRLVHARKIQAYIYDPDGQATIVTGKEAKFFMNKRDIEIFGDVHTTFPDGFELISEYLRYLPNDRKVLIPQKYAVAGDDHAKGDQSIQFTSNGLDFAMARSEIILPDNVRMMMVKKQAPKPGPAGKKTGSAPERTTIESDHAVIHRDKQIAHFTMRPNQPEDKRFVRISQPTLSTRGRRAQLNYGDFSSLLQYMIAFEDVLIKELPDPAAEPARKPPPSSLRYATAGRADFDSKKNVIKLTEFPQCYQGGDTVTGDVIIMHRDTDLVEVEQSNAFSQGQE